MAKTTAGCVKFKFFPDVACQKLLKSANVSQSYSKNKSGMFFMDNSVYFRRYENRANVHIS